MNRRTFMELLGAGLVGVGTGAHAANAADRPAELRPNILWILIEDIGPDFSCYDTPLIRTPNIDRLASEGVRYTSAFTTSPVCSPSRSAMITGMYQTSIGAHHHRSHRQDGYRLPAPVRPITDYLRETGYFTLNATDIAPGVKGSGKQDFNFEIENPYDGTDWNQRKPGQPFFAHLNFNQTHRMARNMKLNEQLPYRIDPEQVRVPPCYPDHPVSRKDWADYLDAIQVVDSYVGKTLERLDADGLAENTVVLLIGDNGQCHVRGKGWLYDAGIHIPLIIRWPGKIAPGTVCDDLVSAIDLSATVLAIAGLEPPGYMQGQVILGPGSTKRDCIFAARDRLDTTVDRIRCVRTKRHKYIRNYMPERPYTQHNEYKEKYYPVLQLMKDLHAATQLTPEQAQFMAPVKPAEELYDVVQDPYELHNLADAPEFRPLLEELRLRLDNWIRKTGDLGQYAEGEEPYPH